MSLVVVSVLELERDIALNGSQSRILAAVVHFRLCACAITRLQAERSRRRRLAQLATASEYAPTFESRQLFSLNCSTIIILRVCQSFAISTYKIRSNLLACGVRGELIEVLLGLAFRDQIAAQVQKVFSAISRSTGRKN